MGSASVITRVCCEAVQSAILATAWLLVFVVNWFSFQDIINRLRLGLNSRFYFSFILFYFIFIFISNFRSRVLA